MKLLVLLTILALANADLYLHHPRGSNNRLNEASAERNNGDRIMDTQNNNRGGYNVGDKTQNPAPNTNPAADPLTSYDATDISTAMQYPFVYIEGSTLRTEWTNQHGCGGHEGNDPYKLNCNLVLQYMCDTSPTAPVAPTMEMQVGLRDGGNTNTPNEPNTYTDISTGATASQNAANQNGRHESEAWYYMCKRRLRNHGLFHADQNMNGETARFTRQNNNGNRQGLECPEERDYYPYWSPAPWIDIAYITSNPEHCDMVGQNSQNNNTIGYCDGVLPTATDQYDTAVPLTQEDCLARAAANNPSTAVWRTINKGLPGPDCMQGEWGRVNHLGNGRNGQHHYYDWKIPSFDMLVAKGYLAVDTNFLRCIFRIRYNISTDDYDPWTANSTMDDNEYMGVLSPIRQNPTVDIGAHDLTGLRLALNTNQFGRTFQDRSHIFYIMKRPATFGNAEIYNLNVRGKRGNIVQVYPSVEYDFVPNTLTINTGDYVHVQWTGSNTHNNGNPAGDGQAGDAGEGTDGTDRNNFVQMGDLSENYPLPLDKYGMDDISIFQHTTCWTYTGTQITSWADCALTLATSGQYRTMAQVSADPNNFDPLLNNAPPSLIGGLVLGFSGTASGHTFNYMCTRNNNFSNRSQKATIIVN